MPGASSDSLGLGTSLSFSLTHAINSVMNNNDHGIHLLDDVGQGLTGGVNWR